MDRSIRALIVEDDPSWKQILSEILSDMGLTVDLASSYEEAVMLLRQQPHRLAILDLSLGGTDHHNQDGIRVADAVRRVDPGCLILFLTGFATVELAVQVMKEQNAFTCLRKEVFRRAEFRKVVNEALSKAPLPAVPETSLEPGSDYAMPGGANGQQAVQLPQPEIALVVEDDAGWRSLLSELLEDAGFQVHTCTSYVEATGFLRRARCNLAVIDLSLASSLTQDNMDGYRLLTNIKKASIPVIVVSGYVDPVRIEQAYSDKLIFACVEKQAFDRKSFLQTLENTRKIAAENPLLMSLTDREREVLVLLARGLTNKEIARDLTITPNTVKRHLKSLFAKLDVNTRSAASAMAISMGLKDNR